MTQETRRAIETLSAKVRDYNWSLYNGTIRCPAIDDSEHHRELTLCPIAMAVTHAGSDRIRSILEDGDYAGFHTHVETARPGIRRHLAEDDPELDEEELEAQTLLYSAASVIHDTPDRKEAACLLEVDTETLDAIAGGADTPDSEVGRALVRALANDGNFLQDEYDAAYGKPTAPGK